jgi:competence protein ComEC
VLHKEVPFLRIGLPLFAGIVTGLYFRPGPYFLVLASFLIISGFVLSLFFNKYQTNLIYGLSLTAALYTLGLILYTNEKTRISILELKPAQFYCTLSDYAEEKDKSFRLVVELEKVKMKNALISVNGSMIVYVRKDSMFSSFLPGDHLVIRCTPVEIGNRGNPNEFDYRFYMENQGIRYSAFTQSKNIIRIGEPDHRKLTHKALIIRHKIIDMYQERGIRGDTLALVAAITLGQKNLLDPEQKQYFMKAGVMHIMAVSGLHAVILSFFIFKMLFFFKGRFNIIRIILTLLLLWSFAFVTGLTPSVLRATLMFSFLQAGMLMKRPVNSINSVLASAFVLILMRPSVIFDAGFLLSYAAVIFIICFYQDLYLKLQFKKWLTDQIWQTVAVTVVAQVGTLPLTIMLFNRFPTWFIISNTIIVPLSSLLIIIGCLVPMTFPVLFLSRSLALILGFMTGLTETLTRVASVLPYATIENIGMTIFESILLTGTIYLFCSFFLKKESFSINIPLTALLLFILACTIKNISNRATNELIVYNTIGSAIVGIRTGEILNVYSDTGILQPDVIRHGATRGLKMRMIRTGTGPRHLKVCGKNILICNSLNSSILKETKSEIAILVGTYPQIDKKLSSFYSLKKLIISSEVSTGFSLPAKLVSTEIDTIHFVRKSGAYSMRL